MPTPLQIQQAIQQVTDHHSFIHVLLRQTLGWEIPEEAGEMEEIAYSWSIEELRAEGLNKEIVDGQIWQIQPMVSDAQQDWGIFVLEFKRPDAFGTGRGMAGLLRKVLSGLVNKARGRPSHLPAWEREHLLFICTYKYQHFRFGYFRAPRDKEKTATLAHFGWTQGDTHIQTLARCNLPPLAFPKDGGADRQAWVSQWQSAFDKSKVTEQFYKDYVDVLNSMEESLVGLENTDKEPHARRDYARLVLGRLMFLYFLQKKGWLGIAGQTSTKGARLQPEYAYLETHFDQVTSRARTNSNSTTFYDDFLTGLFFSVLNVPRSDRPPQVTRKYGEIPFLNGGLFHRTNEELYHKDRLHIPDDVFRKVFDPQDGLFLKYNFTVKEDEPLDVIVAVDPEMLGLVFERQVVEREVKGAFYTPLSVVGFMCQRSLAEYLSAETVVPCDKVAHLLEQEDAAQLTEAEAHDVFDRLSGIAVCDAAAGSGAFLLGMLHRLVRLNYAVYRGFPSVAKEMRRRLQKTAPAEMRLKSDWTEHHVRYLLKRSIVRNNLFGVDIEPSAIQIAQLRMWLSLCVEHEADFVQEIPPLPNLDYNLRVGNSLTGHYLGIDFELETDTRSSHLLPIMEDLDRLEAAYYEMTDEREKKQQRDEIEHLHWRLLEEGIRDELHQLPAKRRAVEDALQQRRDGSLFPEVEDFTSEERADLAWLERRKTDLDAGLAALTTDQRHLREEERSRHPVLWRVHFARVFREKGGFDIVIMNPPYVSTQGASELDYVPDLTAKLGFNDDLYVFFAFRSFGLPHFLGIARPGGVVCYITSDTFFTLQTKTRMRQLLQSRDLRLLVQCDPFKQTVDTAIFLALNQPPQSGPDILEFIQARPVLDRFPPIAFDLPWSGGAGFLLPVSVVSSDDALPETGDDEPQAEEENSRADAKADADPTVNVRECEHDGLRRYLTPAAVYRNAIKSAFFEPSPRNAILYNRFMERTKRLVDEWWDKIEDSRKFDRNRELIDRYHRSLQPGDVTIAGLICEGGQGMAPANNGRFLGYLEGTPQAEAIIGRRRVLETRWDDTGEVARVYRRLKARTSEFPELADSLKEHFPGEDNWRQVLGFKRGEIYRIVQANLICDVDDLSARQRSQMIRKGIKGKKCWVPYRKGDPEGNKWVSFDPLYICWSEENVEWLSTHSGQSEANMPVLRNRHLYLTDGITWTRIGNHVCMKARIQPKCVFDADSVRLTPITSCVSAHTFLAMLNSDLLSYFCKRFLLNTAKYEIGAVRMLPIVIPTPSQEAALAQLAQRAIAVQTEILRDGRTERREELDRIQCEVNTAVEELYGVAGMGPFNEF